MCILDIRLPVARKDPSVYKPRPPHNLVKHFGWPIVQHVLPNSAEAPVRPDQNPSPNTLRFPLRPGTPSRHDKRGVHCICPSTDFFYCAGCHSPPSLAHHLLDVVCTSKPDEMGHQPINQSMGCIKPAEFKVSSLISCAAPKGASLRIIR
jgi:hypothetical protein